MSGAETMPAWATLTMIAGFCIGLVVGLWIGLRHDRDVCPSCRRLARRYQEVVRR